LRAFERISERIVSVDDEIEAGTIAGISIVGMI
jgi:hypothetical protein